MKKYRYACLDKILLELRKEYNKIIKNNLSTWTEVWEIKREIMKYEWEFAKLTDE